MTDLTNESGVLLCAHCGGEYLRHTATRNYVRDSEDSTMGARVVTTSNDSHIARNVRVGEEEGNPSGRRDGVAIEFVCEWCPGLSELTIAQHKGMTLIATRKSQRCPAAD